MMGWIMMGWIMMGCGMDHDGMDHDWSKSASRGNKSKSSNCCGIHT